MFGLHGGVIICFMDPWVYEILRQMFRGGGGDLLLVLRLIFI